MKVLIADDEMHIRYGLQKSVRWEEFGVEQIFTAQDGREALMICLKERPEILITDIRMPGMDGLALAREAITSAGVKKVVILSGYSEFEYAKTAIGLGVVDYLLKPVKLEELSKLLLQMAEDIRLAARQDQLHSQELIWKVLRGTENPGVLRKLWGNNANEIAIGVLQWDTPYAGDRTHGEFQIEHLMLLAKSEQEALLLFTVNS